MTTKQLQHLLNYLGYDTGGCDGIYGSQTRQAVWDFQGDYGGIAQDGDAGAETEGALLDAVGRGWLKPSGQTKQSPQEDGDALLWDEIQYFTRDEFRCPCGRWCNGFPVEPDPQLVREVNAMRIFLGVAVIVVPPDGHSGGSGIRCQQYNDSLEGSVPNSYHVLGKAADFSAPRASAATIESYLASRQTAGAIRYWYMISPGSYHMDVA